MTTQRIGYHPASRILHWLVAALVLSTFPAGVIMTGEDLSRPVQDALFIYHKNVGVIIFALMLVRLVLRVAYPAPPLPTTLPDWQRLAAKLSHWLLYILIFAMTISGYVRVVTGGFPIEMLDALNIPPLLPESEDVAETAKSIHASVRFALFAVIALHIGAALYHALVLRDGVFSHMGFGRNRSHS